MLRSLFLIIVFSAFAFTPVNSVKADNNRGLAITGVALGGTALALSAYNTYQNHRIRHGDYRYAPRRSYYQNPRRIRGYRNCRRNNRYYPNYNRRLRNRSFNYCGASPSYGY